MELSELQTIWTQYDKTILENISINKQILRQMLIAKPRQRLNWMQFRSAIGLIIPPIAIIMFVNTVKLREPGPELYFGVVLAATLCIISLVREIRYFLLLLKTDLSIPVLKINERIKKIEVYKMKNVRIRYLFTVLSLVAFYMISHLNMSIFIHIGIPESILIIVIVLVFFYKSWTHNHQFSELNKELKQIEELER